MKRVWLVTDGIFHPPLAGRLALQRALREVGAYRFSLAGGLEELPDDFGDAAALVLYFHQVTISKEALDRLDRFVDGGGGVLALHSATASFKEEPHYFEILGGRFTGHGPVSTFELRPTAEADVFEGIPFFTVRDECYLHDTSPDIQVHFTAQVGRLTVPAVWTHRYGDGRVCYAVPGHRTSSIRNPYFQEVLRRGLDWVSGV
jgi:type 1 glutamine amidotransferase